jgi:hypothetical protein
MRGMKINTLREYGNDYKFRPISVNFRPKPPRSKIFSLHPIGLKTISRYCPFQVIESIFSTEFSYFKVFVPFKLLSLH